MALLTKDAQDKAVQLLVSEGLVSNEAIKQIQAEVAQTKQPFLAALTAKKLVDDETLTHVTAVVSGVPYVDLRHVRIDQEMLSVIPSDVASRSMVIPLGEHNGQLVVAMLDVSNVQATDYLASMTQRMIKPVMASEEGIRSVLAQYNSDFSSVKKAAKVANAEAETKLDSEGDVRTITQDSPISKALTTILEYAAKSHSSDIHIEPLEKALVIRCRVDGVLRRVMELPKSIEAALVSRVKILATL